MHRFRPQMKYVSELLCQLRLPPSPNLAAHCFSSSMTMLSGDTVGTMSLSASSKSAALTHLSCALSCNQAELNIAPIFVSNPSDVINCVVRVCVCAPQLLLCVTQCTGNMCKSSLAAQHALSKHYATERCHSEDAAAGALTPAGGHQPAHHTLPTGTAGCAAGAPGLLFGGLQHLHH